MHHSPGVTFLDNAGTVILLLWAFAMWGAVAVLALASRRAVAPWMFRASAAVIILGILGQLGHIQEHVAQTGYWVANPEAQPWMTPWGTGLANGFGQIDTSKPSLGMEILHFTGNLIFLAGIVGVMLITRRALGTRARRYARMGVWMQGIHGIEHAVLTLSVALGASRAIGLSTWFGLLEPGPGLWTYRIWWHMLANLVGSVIFGIAVYHLWRERRQIRESHRLLLAGSSVPPQASPAPLVAQHESGPSAGR
ncbi:DUF6008 family protein [Streptomyces sp. S.PB5]|uniref:DUF6008 family protein n=1 Tax=Streptomyces sp. S.PB5 TaxID=3020844 RepID=UPI0025B0C6DA|nr:DUF6008 family protein [Streptomyces sp. S.PB5]MDN3027112.1 DUF6008 family protein [Streptomyces sp. S.PB5]